MVESRSVLSSSIDTQEQKNQGGLQRNQSGHPAENGPDWMGNRNNNLANGFAEGLPLSRKMFNHS